MTKKNWKEIALISEATIRHALIHARGDHADRLCLAYPECFSKKNEAKLSLKEILELTEKLSRKEVEEVCSDSNIPCESFRFSGSCKGTTQGLPMKTGSYNAGSYGWSDEFRRSTLEPGETVLYKDCPWVVVRNGFIPGDVYTVSSHSLTIVPQEALQ